MRVSADRLTRPTDGEVAAFLETVTDPARREDAHRAVELFRDVTGVEPVMWGSAMVGFGRQPYRTADGKQREWFAVGLSPRKAALTLYGLTYDGSSADLLARLGKHTTGKGCLYLKRLDDADPEVLRDLVAQAWANNHEEPQA